MIGAMATDQMSQECVARDEDTRDQVATVNDRWSRRPRPYRSFAEYQRALADAYQSRALFWNDVIEHAIHHGPRGLVFSALLDARTGCDEAARQARREARDAARRDQEQALASYADNIQAARTATLLGMS